MEVNSWSDHWFEAHGLFLHEVFLYAVAALLKKRAYHALNRLFLDRYLTPETMRYGSDTFSDFGVFQVGSESFGAALSAPEGRKYASPTGELIKRSADRSDIKFVDIMEADLLALFMAAIQPNVFWYPRTLLYSNRYKNFPLFVRAVQRRGFHNLSIITGISDVTELKSKAEEGLKRLNVDRWHDFWMNRGFSNWMRLSELNSID